MSDISSVNNSTSPNYYVAQSQQKQSQDPMQDVASLLGMSDNDLHTELQSGQTLSDIAKSKGVSESDLESTIAKSLQDNPPPGAQPLSDSQASQMAANIASGQAPQGGGHHHHHHHGGGSNAVDSLTSALSGQGTNSASDTLSSLADALGIDSDTLTQQLQSGDSTDLGAELTSAFGGTSGLQYDGLL